MDQTDRKVIGGAILILTLLMIIGLPKVLPQHSINILDLETVILGLFTLSLLTILISLIIRSNQNYLNKKEKLLKILNVEKRININNTLERLNLNRKNIDNMMNELLNNKKIYSSSKSDLKC